MKSLIPFFLALFLPVAVADPADSSAALEASLAEGLSRYTRLYFRTESALTRFDRELDAASEAGLLERSESYRELLALRALRETLAHDLGEKYAKLRTRAPKALLRFQAVLARLTLLERVALDDLFAEFPGEARLSEEEIRAVLKNERRTIELRAFEERYALEAEVEPLSERIIPLSQTIRPSPGPEGNLTGRTFPLGTWALTYDDGPHPTRTDSLLEILREAGLLATFFQLAEKAEALPEVVQNARRAGMALANHSFSHRELPKVDSETLRYEIAESTNVLARHFGERPRFFRLPYGAGMSNRAIRELIAEEGMVHVFWNVDTLDWQDKDPESIFARAKKQMLLEGRGIVLFHDIHAQTLEASKLVISFGEEQGLRWVTLPEIVDELSRP